MPGPPEGSPRSSPPTSRTRPARPAMRPRRSPRRSPASCRRRASVRSNGARSRCCRASRRSHGCPSPRRRPATGRRCRRGWRTPSPSSQRTSLSAPSVIPASTLTRPVSRSMSTMRSIRSSDSRVPSVRTASVNECPEPATLTVRPPSRARPIALATAPRSAGRSKAAGRQLWSPAKFVQVAGIGSVNPRRVWVRFGRREPTRTHVRGGNLPPRTGIGACCDCTQLEERPR